MSARARLCRRHVPCVGEVDRLGHVTINGRDVDLDAPAPKSSAGAGLSPDPAPAGPSPARTP